jgi:hypothetical protein
MAVTFANITRSGGNSYTYTWTGTGPYDLYIDGVLYYPQDGVLPTTDTSIIITNFGDNEEPRPLEIIDTSGTDVADNINNGPQGILQWRGDLNAASYIVQQKVSGTFVDIAPVREDRRGYYRYDTVALDDVTTHNWRVLPRDEHAVNGDPVEFDFFMVRNPVPKKVEYSYDAGTGNLTIADRT